jgi:hypothetical protein
MGMDIDKAGRYDHTLGIDFRQALTVISADRNDLAIGDRKVTSIA